MLLDEIVTRLGIEADIAKLKQFVGAVSDGVKRIAGQANAANAALTDVNDRAAEGARDAAVAAQEAEKPLNRMKLIALGVGTLITGLAAKLTGFVVGAIAGAHDLASEKGLLYQISAKELAQADAYTAATHKNQLAIESLRTKIALNLAPALTQMQEGFYSILVANKDLITNGLTKVIQFVGKFGQVLRNGWEAIDLIISGTIGWKAALMVLVGVLAIVKRATIQAFIANPVFWVVAAIAGLLLLVDDLMTYLHGGKSQFGDFWGACITWIRVVKAWWNGLTDDWKGTLGLLSGMIATAFSVHALKTFVSSAKILSSVLKPLTSTIGLVSKAFTFLRAAILANPLGWAIALIAALIYIGYDLYKWLHGGKSQFGAWYQAIADTIGKVKAWFNDLFNSIFRWFGASEKDAQKYTDGLAGIFNAVMSFLIRPFTAALDYIKGLYAVFTDDTTSWTEKLAAVFELNKKLLSAPFKAAWAIVKAVFAAFGGDANKFIAGIGKTFSGVIDKITAPFKAAFDEVKTYYDNTVGKLSGAWDSVKNGASGLSDTVGGWFGASNNTTSPRVGSSPNQANNRSVSVNGGAVTVTNNIQTNHPDEAGQVVSKSVETGYKRALNNAATGVAG